MKFTIKTLLAYFFVSGTLFANSNLDGKYLYCGLQYTGEVDNTWDEDFKILESKNNLIELVVALKDLVGNEDGVKMSNEFQYTYIRDTEESDNTLNASVILLNKEGDILQKDEELGLVNFYFFDDHDEVGIQEYSLSDFAKSGMLIKSLTLDSVKYDFVCNIFTSENYFNELNKIINNK